MYTGEDIVVESGLARSAAHAFIAETMVVGGRKGRKGPAAGDVRPGGCAEAALRHLEVASRALLRVRTTISTGVLKAGWRSSGAFVARGGGGKLVRRADVRSGGRTSHPPLSTVAFSRPSVHCFPINQHFPVRQFQHRIHFAAPALSQLEKISKVERHLSRPLVQRLYSPFARGVRLKVVDRCLSFGRHPHRRSASIKTWIVLQTPDHLARMSWARGTTITCAHAIFLGLRN